MLFRSMIVGSIAVVSCIPDGVRMTELDGSGIGMIFSPAPGTIPIMMLWKKL